MVEEGVRRTPLRLDESGHFKWTDGFEVESSFGEFAEKKEGKREPWIDKDSRRGEHGGPDPKEGDVFKMRGDNGALTRKGGGFQLHEIEGNLEESKKGEDDGSSEAI